MKNRHPEVDPKIRCAGCGHAAGQHHGKKGCVEKDKRNPDGLCSCARLKVE